MARRPRTCPRFGCAFALARRLVRRRGHGRDGFDGTGQPAASDAGALSAPRASVVVATRDRAKRLDALLSSLHEQTLSPDEFEVIAVDDCSSDATREVLARHAAAANFDL